MEGSYFLQTLAFLAPAPLAAFAVWLIARRMKNPSRACIVGFLGTMVLEIALGYAFAELPLWEGVDFSVIACHWLLAPFVALPVAYYAYRHALNSASPRPSSADTPAR